MRGSTYIDIGWDPIDRLGNNVIDRLAEAVDTTPSESKWQTTINAMIEYLRTVDPESFYEDVVIRAKYRDQLIDALGGVSPNDPNIITTESLEPITNELGQPILRDT